MKKIKKIGRVSIIGEEKVRKKDKDNLKIYEYLESRDFHNYLNPTTRTEDESIYPYIKDVSIGYLFLGLKLHQVTTMLKRSSSVSMKLLI